MLVSAFVLHDKNAIEKAAFSDVELDLKPKHSTGKGKYNTIETVLLSGDARTGYVSQKRIDSPGWSQDGHFLTFEADGHVEQTAFTPLRTARRYATQLPPNQPPNSAILKATSAVKRGSGAKLPTATSNPLPRTI